MPFSPFGATSLKVQRLRLYDYMVSSGPESIGLCQGDVAGCAQVMNEVQPRLINAKEAGDEGWWGTWAEVAFNISQSNPFITTPRSVARLESINMCTMPIPLQNQFYEYMQYTNGSWPKNQCRSQLCSPLSAFTRNNSVTFSDLVPPNKILSIRGTSAADETLRTLIGCVDANDQVVFSLDGPVQVRGVYVNLTLPSSTLSVSGVPLEISQITGIQKDVTVGSVSYYEVDTVTGDERLLLTMEPSETTAYYRRYYLSGVPKNCCGVPAAVAGTVQVTAMAKLEAFPVKVDSDYLLIQNLQALICEAQAWRLSKVDSSAAKGESRERHNAAIGLLQGELVNYLGKQDPAVSFAPFGTARLRRQRIGSMF